MTAFDVYLITILDNVKYCCKGAVTFSIFCLAISFVVWVIAILGDNVHYIVRYKFFPIVCAIILTFSTIFTAMIPTSKQMAVIYIVPKIVNNQKVQQLPSHLMKLLDDYIENLIKDDDKPEVNNNGNTGEKQ